MKLSKVHRDYLTWVISKEGIVSLAAFREQRGELPKLNSRYIEAKLAAREAKKRGDNRAWSRWMNSAKFWKREIKLTAFIVHLGLWQQGQAQTPPDPILD